MKVVTPEGRQLQKALKAEYNPANGIWEVIDRRREDLIEHAIFLQSKGISYRDFLVGSCAVGLFGGAPILFEGANNSPIKGDPRDCAEKGVLEGADSLGSVALRSIYVAGPDDVETISEVTGREVMTLPPCDECRSLLWQSQHTRPDLLVTTIAPGEDPCIEENRLRNLIVEYAELVAPPPSVALARG
jgi:hypothetical protein